MSWIALSAEVAGEFAPLAGYGRAEEALERHVAWRRGVCNRAQRDLAARRRAAGQCTACGAAERKRWRCDDCAARLRKRRGRV